MKLRSNDYLIEQLHTRVGYHFYLITIPALVQGIRYWYLFFFPIRCYDKYVIAIVKNYEL